MMMSLCLVLLTVVSRMGYSLLVRNINSNSTMMFEHQTAHFGPPAGTYNVTGILVASETTWGCEFPNVTYENCTVLILRGHCPFSMKVLHAQEHGAVGVIIGDHMTNGEWVSMVAANKSAVYRIPAVFVQNPTYRFLAKHALRPSNNAPSLPGPSLSDLIAHRRRAAAADTWVVMLNAMGDVVLQGEYGGPKTPMNIWKFVGYLLLFIPTVWCLVTVVLVVVRGIKSCVNKRRREQRLQSIPKIDYIGVAVNNDKGEETPESSATSDIRSAEEGKITEDIVDTVVSLDTPVTTVSDTSETKLLEAAAVQPKRSRISSFLDSLSGKSCPAPPMPHNDTCAICLDEFIVGQKISLLPCRHGFHTHCITPWVRQHSELCPMCKQSIFMSNDGDDADVSDSCLLFKCCSSRNIRRRRVFGDRHLAASVVLDESDGEDDDDDDDGVDSSTQEQDVSGLDDENNATAADNQHAFALPLNSNGYSELPSTSLTREQKIVLQSVRRMGL